MKIELNVPSICVGVLLMLPVVYFQDRSFSMDLAGLKLQVDGARHVAQTQAKAIRLVQENSELMRRSH